MKQQPQSKLLARLSVALALLAATIAMVEPVSGVITVQIGGATRLNSLSRQRDQYRCWWDCDLVGCQIASDDDECAYDCNKICRLRYDYAASAASAAAAAGRSGADTHPSAAAAGSTTLELKSAGDALARLAGKSAAIDASAAAAAANQNDDMSELLGAGSSVRLHLPRNASARNFAIWERCQPLDSQASARQQQLIEKPFNL